MKLQGLLFIAVAMLISSSCNSDEPARMETVSSHQRTTVVCNPKKGNNNYPAWAVFPDSKEKIRRIVMHLTLGTPDSLKTAHWDYCDHINILRVGGENGETKNYEIGRVITPYGRQYGKGWEFRWSIDVTDYSEILRDSVEIEYVHSGYESTDLGWAVSIDFDIYYGTPHIEQIGVEKLWYGNFVYGDPSNPLNEQVPAFDFNLPTGADIARVRIQHTGHGADRTKGCSEFCNRWRTLALDGEIVQTKDLWKKCGDNPLYPQSGTWIFDRGLWCPGDVQEPDITNTYPNKASNKHQLVLDMEPYVTENPKQPKENIRSMMFYYKSPENKNDVLLEDILKPNNDPFYNRLNPAIHQPKIKIRNLGSDTLRTLTIKYHTLIEGQAMNQQEFQWSGKLAYYESAIIDLPGKIYIDQSKANSFEVECLNPNGKKDAWKADNKKVVPFDAPKQMPCSFIIEYKSNGNPEENFIELTDADDKMLFSKMPEEVMPNMLYRDTVHLADGTYAELNLIDTKGQGLSFWYLTRQGFGSLRLLDLNGKLVHVFESDCGVGEKLAIYASKDFDNSRIRANYCIDLFPRATDSTFSLFVHSDTPESKMEVRISRDGKLVKSHKYDRMDKHEYSYDISKWKDGGYVVEMYIDGNLRYRNGVQKK
ncbi:MAG: peptide-N-glycosidase F-related protein [Mangrovibacterium sp.]